jgi:hypothetical protein
MKGLNKAIDYYNQAIEKDPTFRACLRRSG